jgi:hypothetical protein
MAICCECRHCTTKFWAPDTLAGQKIACPVCERAVRVPGEARAPAAAGPPKAPSLLDVLEEELGPGAALTAAAEEMSGWRTSRPAGRAWEPGYRGMMSRRTMIRLSPQAALGVFGSGVLAFYVLILLAKPLLGWFLSLLLLLGGIALVFTGVCWQLYVALREETACFVWSVVTFPFYFLFFLMTRWEKTKNAFLVILGGLAVCGGAAGAMVYASYLANPHKEQPASADQTGKPGAKKGVKLNLSLDPEPAGADAGKAPPATPAGTAPKPPPAKKTALPKPPANEVEYEPAKDLLTPPGEAWKDK